MANLIECFEKDLPAAFMFIDTFFKTEAREWFNIDRLRLDKFMMVSCYTVAFVVGGSLVTLVVAFGFLPLKYWERVGIYEWYSLIL